MKIKVRKTKEEDCRRVAHVHRSSIKKLCSSSYKQDVIDSWAAGCSADGVRKALRRKEINNIVAEIDGVICGIGASVNNRIWLVYVHPDWVGNGVGDKILQRLEKDMLKKKINDVVLQSSLNAYNFYIRNGYVKIKKRTLEFRDGAKVPCIEMNKRLK
jgi:GNAT superfamily N-acetyltransferase